MRTILLLAASLLLRGLQAQIVIGPTDMPSAGDTVRYHTTTAGDVDLVLTGANVLWDFSDLTLGLEGADTAVSVSSTPFAYQFFFNNNLLYPQHSANFAMKGAGFDFQVVSFEDVYDYFKNDANGFRNVGFGANLNGIPTSIRRIPVDWEYRFPMAFGNMDTSFSAFNVNVPTVGYYGQSQTRFNHVDGWGTLLLPGGGSHQVLRVRSVLAQRDTLFVDQFGIGFGVNRPQTVEYKWLAPGRDLPVLEVVTVGGFATTARFQYEEVTTGVGALPPGHGLHTWPNPADELLHILLPADRGGLLLVLDAMGREVLRDGPHAGGTLVALHTGQLAKGMYLLRLEDATGSNATRFVVRH
jgi:hypothetical protein